MNEFEGEHFDEGFRIDLFVDGKVIIELKSVEKVIPAHKKQLLIYLKLTNTKLGYIINFGEELMKDGIVRIINGIMGACGPLLPPCPRERPFFVFPCAPVPL